MSAKKDVIFDRLADRFQKRIYASRKGDIRLAILTMEMHHVIHPWLKHKSACKIVDMGAGFAQMSIALAKEGYKIEATEPSAKMRRVAQQQIDAAGVTDLVTLHADTLQHYIARQIKEEAEAPDLIIIHAVLEWLAEPQEAIKLIASYVKPGGRVSVIFYNRHSIALRSLLGGDFQRVIDDKLDGVGQKGLTPISPLVPDEVLGWIKTAGGEVIHHSGLRTFADYMKPQASEEASDEDIIRTEHHLSQQEPWRSIARYQHIIFSTKTSI